jgi:4-diphosphocytidyl-2-C-methyl-D-erythritol kinase
MSLKFKATCPAKINLFLKVTGKRPDGFHELESLFAFLDLADEFEVEKSDKFKLEITGEFGNFVNLEDNLFTKILDFFAREFSISKNLHIKIKKNIPVGAGLGGGSSNAAYFMKALNEIFSLNLSKEKLQEISLNFGSDIAFFFEGKASIVKGRGEVIENFPEFKAITALLINPRIHLATKEVFQKFDGNFSKEIPTENLLKKDIFDLIKDFSNDLEKPAISIVPTIFEILEKLKNSGAKIAKMSGSGATCFGIFADEKKLDEAAKSFPEFFVKKVRILSQPYLDFASLRSIT